MDGVIGADDGLTSGLTSETPLGAPGTPPVAPARSSVNIMTLTFVHDLLADSISATGSFPLICDPREGHLENLRQLLVKEYDRVTAPLSEKNPLSPMWGEWTENPGEDLQREGLAESAPKLIVVKG